MNQETKVAGLKVNFLSKQEVLRLIKARLQTNQKTWLTTVYSEFLYAGLNNPAVMQMLNKANIAIPDGIGIFWAKNYLSIPLTVKSYWGKVFQSLFQAKHSLLKLLLNKKGIQTIPGSELIWDISKMAQENNWSIFLLGGYGDTPKIAAEKISIKFPNLKINLCNKNPADLSVIEEINKAKPDILLVAYGPIRQEKWISENLENLSTVKLAVGLGGTFDYIAGKKISPPKFIRTVGLEWLWRLLTQPSRYKRIYKAFFGLIAMLMRYKVFNSYPIRKNAVAVILNNENKIFLGRKHGSRVDIITNNNPEKWKDYWQLPQGGIEGTEDIVSAVKREAEEETGIKETTFIKLSPHTHTYIWNNALRKLGKRNSGYPFKGQTQTIVYLKYNGDNDNIKLPPDEEFSEYQWANAKDLDKIIHEERINLTKIVQADLKEMLEKGKLT